MFHGENEAKESGYKSINKNIRGTCQIHRQRKGFSKSVAQRRKSYRKRFRPKFENGGFWEYYLDLERQFEDFAQYVPYIDKNKRVSSFRLVNLLLGIGGHIDPAFKEMATYKAFSKNEECQIMRRKVWENRKRIRENKKPDPISIQQHLKAFEAIYSLSHQEVTFKLLPEDEIVVPFYPHNPATKAPEWWDIYIISTTQTLESLCLLVWS